MGRHDPLVAFVQARHTNDEQTALAAAEAELGRHFGTDDYDAWRERIRRWMATHFLFGKRVVPGELQEWYGSQPIPPVADGTYPPVAEHIAFHDPQRVLDDVKAGRALLAGLLDEDRCDCDAWGHHNHDEQLRWLAWPYRRHSDWQPEWAPEGADSGE